MNNISEIWNMKQNNDLVLTFDKETNLHEIYHEAFINGLWVDVDHNPYTNVTVVKSLNNHKCDDIAEQMINTLMFENESKPFYKGDLNPTSLRTALYRTARKHGINVKTGTHNDTLYCFMNTSEIIDFDELFKDFKKAGVFEVNIDIPEGVDVKKVRSNVFNYTSRKGLKIRTRVIGNTLRVTRLINTPVKNGSLSEELLKWVDEMPFDTPLPIPDMQGLKQSSMPVILNRKFGGTCTIDKGLVCKHSFRLSKENGCLTLRVKGVVVLRFDVSRRNQLTSGQWDKINSILSHHGVTSEVL